MKLADLSTGVILDNRFRLVEILGRGSYGDVWLAEVIKDETLPAQVALKIYHHQERATRKLLEEAEFALGFEHQQLVTVYGAERVDGLVIMWMEYVHGETLLDRLGANDSPRPVSLEEVQRWMQDIAEALAYLHAHDPPWVHGDLKLDNVLLDNERGARLADFGQSRTIEDRFVETDGVGAWPYLAPEILGGSTDGRGQRYVSSDIYAYGVIAYRLLTGRFPRRTVSEAINLATFPRPIELNPSVPKELDELVCRCLENRPNNRYPTGASLLAAVQKVRDALATKAIDRIETPAPVDRIFPTPAEELAVLARQMLEEGQVEEVVDRLETAMERMSTSPGVMLVYAEAAKRVGKFDAARTVYQRAARWMERNGYTDDERRDAVEGLADLNVKLKRYEEAVGGFDWLADRWPEKRWYYYQLGVAQGLAGRYRASIESLHKIHDQGAPLALVCAKIGLAYLQLNEVEQASQYFNEALMLDEYEPTALFQLARVRAIQRKTDRALAYLNRLEQIEGAEDQARELGRLLGKAQPAQR